MIYVERNMIPLPEVFYSKDGEYADFDKEWLVPPATQRLFEGGKVEYSSILDGACFEGPNILGQIKSSFRYIIHWIIKICITQRIEKNISINLLCIKITGLHL